MIELYLLGKYDKVLFGKIENKLGENFL